MMMMNVCDTGAIKFGDKLANETSQELLSSLASCDLPFQCAHGRPSIAPLISLRQLKMTLAEKVST
jgi:DNA mismatch repair protein MLH3